MNLYIHGEHRCALNTIKSTIRFHSIALVNAIAAFAVPDAAAIVIVDTVAVVVVVVEVIASQYQLPSIIFASSNHSNVSNSSLACN